MLGATGIEHVTVWRFCLCDLRLLGEAQFGLNVARHLRKKTRFLHQNEKCCNQDLLAKFEGF